MEWKQVLSLICAFSILSGCGINRSSSSAADHTSNGTQTLQNVKESVNPSNQTFKSDQASSQRLADLAKQIKGVNHATVVVLGNYAIVGLDIDPTLGRHQTGNIKYDVANAIKNDPNGAHALVTSDPDLIQRLKDINAGIQNGKPIKGIMDQLALVVERIMPDTSNDFNKLTQ